MQVSASPHGRAPSRLTPNPSTSFTYVFVTVCVCDFAPAHKTGTCGIDGTDYVETVCAVRARILSARIERVFVCGRARAFELTCVCRCGRSTHTHIHGVDLVLRALARALFAHARTVVQSSHNWCKSKKLGACVLLAAVGRTCVRD